MKICWGSGKAVGALAHIFSVFWLGKHPILSRSFGEIPTRSHQPSKGWICCMSDICPANLHNALVSLHDLAVLVAMEGASPANKK